MLTATQLGLKRYTVSLDVSPDTEFTLLAKSKANAWERMKVRLRRWGNVQFTRDDWTIEEVESDE